MTKIPQTILGPNGLSGINPAYRDSLLQSKSTTYLECELVVDFPLKGCQNYIPTYISVCPICNNKQKWRTTGIIPNYISCDKCNSHFKQ